MNFKSFYTKKELHPIQKDDVLYFLHIPKTAGTTLISILDNYFDYEDVCLSQAWNDIINHSPTELLKFRLFRGHFGYWLYRILPKKPLYMTMLREPVSRAVSEFFQGYRNTPIRDDSLNEFHNLLNKERDYSRFRNTQVRHIGLDLDVSKINRSSDPDENYHFATFRNLKFTNPKIPDKELTKIAKKRIQEFLFVGILERFEESIMLLCYTFGWKFPRNIESLNSADRKTQKIQIPKNILEEINERVMYDKELYEFAVSLFEKRYSNMIHDLKSKYLVDTNEKLTKETLLQLLDRHYYNIQRKDNIRSDSLEFSFRQGFSGHGICSGSGWHSREFDPLRGSVFRWTGPETKSTIIFPSNKNNSVKTQIRVINQLLPNTSIKIKVNDIDIDHNVLNMDDGALIYEFEASKSIVKKSDFIKITLELDKTVSPSSINGDSKDDRRLGIAIDRIRTFPQ